MSINSPLYSSDLAQILGISPESARRKMKFVKEKMENTVFVGLDMIRNLITKSKATDDFNAIAFDAIFLITGSFLSNNINVVIDSGITKERDKRLKDIALKNSTDIFMFYLSAPKEVLWERIQKRGSI